MPLSPEDRQVLEKMQKRLEDAMAGVRKWQVAINAVYEAADEVPPYPPDGPVDAPSSAPRPRHGQKYGPAEFYGKPLATIARRIIQDHNGAVSETVLYETMVGGGFKFEQSNDDDARQYLRSTLGKNPGFDRTTTGYYVLRDPSAARKRAKETGQVDPQADPSTAQPVENGAQDAQSDEGRQGAP